MRHLTRSLLGAAAVLAVAAPAASAVPTGYTRVFSPAIHVPSGPLDAGGQVACPAGTVPWGGGVGFTGGTSEVGQDINTSAPTGDGWRGRYNNRNGRTTDFVVGAICAAQPKKYTVTFASTPNPAGSQSSATAVCPVKTVLLSGGSLSTSDEAQAFLLGAYPSSTTSFTAVMWNGTTRNETLTTFAICGRKPKGYELHTSTGSGTGPATFLGGGHCKPGKVLIGGGVRPGTFLPAIGIGSSLADEDTQWLYELNVGATGPTSVTVSTICVP
jgi:hypothetical protein